MYRPIVRFIALAKHNILVLRNTGHISQSSTLATKPVVPSLNLHFRMLRSNVVLQLVDAPKAINTFPAALARRTLELPWPALVASRMPFEIGQAPKNLVASFLLAWDLGARFANLVDVRRNTWDASRGCRSRSMRHAAYIITKRRGASAIALGRPGGSWRDW